MSLFARSLPITLASMLLAVVSLSGCNSSASEPAADQPVSVRVAEVTGGQVVEIPLRFSGIVRAAQRATLTFQVSGTLKERPVRSEEHTSELQSRPHLVCRLLLEKKKE